MSELDDIQVRLCLLGKECPEVAHGIEFAGPEFLDAHPLNCICGGTGKVPLLEGVREKCPDLRHHLKPHGSGFVLELDYWSPDKECLNCQGRDWVPSQNPWAYFKAIAKIKYLYLATPRSHSIKKWACAVEGEDASKGVVIEGDDPELAFYSAMVKALGVGQ